MKSRNHKWVAGIIICFALFGCHKKTESEPIPADAAVYCRFVNLEESWKTLSEREFFRGSAQWQIWNEPWMKEALKPLTELRADFEKNSGVPLNKDTIMMLFGQRVDLAIIPDNPLPSFILISELGKKSSALKLISRTMESMDKERLNTYEFQDITITAIRSSIPTTPAMSSIQEVVYCFDDDRIIAASSREVLEQLITLRETPDRTLRNTSDFIDVTEVLNAPDNLIYIQPDQMMKIASTVTDPTGAGTNSQIWANVWAAALAVTETGLTINTALKPPQENIMRWETIYRNPDAVERSGKWLSSDCIAGSVAGIDIPGLMEHQKTILSTIDNPDGLDMWTKFTTLLQDFTGIDIPGELTLWGGKGMFFTMENIRMVSLIPIPDLAFGLHIRDRGAAEEFVRTMQQRIEEKAGPGSGTFTRESIGEEFSYHYLPIPLLPGFQPGYSLIDDYLVFGTSSQTVLHSLNASLGKNPGLLQNPAMAPIVSSGMKELIAYQTFDPPRFSVVAKTALDGISLFLIAVDQKPAVYREILDSLNSIPLIAFRLTLQDNMVVYNGIVEMR